MYNLQLIEANLWQLVDVFRVFALRIGKLIDVSALEKTDALYLGRLWLSGVLHLKVGPHETHIAIKIGML